MKDERDLGRKRHCLVLNLARRMLRDSPKMLLVIHSLRYNSIGSY